MTRFWVVLLCGYGLLDRGFAYFSVPGTPLFVGELLVLGIVILFAISTRWFVGHRLVPVAALLAYCTWAAIRTAQGVPVYQLDAIRDAALWYYCAFAAFTIAWFRRTGPAVAFDRAVRFFERFLVIFLAWTPFAVIADRLSESSFGPKVPGSEVALLTHKVSNIAPLLALVALYAWHYPSARYGPKARLAIFVAALIDLALVGTQTRGGFLGGAFGLLVGSLLLPGRLRATKIAFRGLLIFVAIFGLAFAFDLKVSSTRDMSVRQLTNNVLSVVDDGDSAPVQGSLDETKEWRHKLWTSILDKTFATHREVTGWGFGVNLGFQVGFDGKVGDPNLRSAHNSHLSVFARMGMIGAFGWALVWLTWSAALIQLARDRMFDHPRARVAAASLVGVECALHLNAYFDPAFESPQVGAWLWTVFGVGCGLLLMRADVRRRPGSSLAAEVPSAAGGVGRVGLGVQPSDELR